MKTDTDNKQDDAQKDSAVRDCPDSAGSPESTKKLLEMAVFWMRKSQDYSPPRPQDVGRMLKCADYIEQRLKENTGARFPSNADGHSYTE
jgi:hypothetical protein